FVGRFNDALQPPPESGFEPDHAPVAAVLHLVLTDPTCGDRAAGNDGSPWTRLRGFRLNADHVEQLRLRADEETRQFTLKRLASGLQITCGAKSFACAARIDSDGALDAHINGRRVRAAATFDRGRIELWLEGNVHRFMLADPDERRAAAQAGHGHLTAPMPGKIIAVLVETGAVVARGQPLVTMEAMKMEHTIAAPFDGVVETVRFGVGDVVSEGADLIHLTVRS
ncbi:MAG TPA: biotin/lipoyl-containing protein, partial [Gammaproteobacteria bacterium]|nr:biotin/lipoyl-containing protein [Gammaproteobacteria bacterium]